jgi:dephospho-CoA kinase
MTNKRTKIIGLTGSIGTGKSTVAWMFEELGVPTLNADTVAHEMIEPRKPAWKQIYERYGKAILQGNDLIDRKALSQIVFRDPEERKFLESAIHPHVKEELKHRIGMMSKAGHPFFIIEVPLLFEANWTDIFDAIIVVRCSEETEIRRCTEKFHVDNAEIKLRIAAQLPLSEKAAGADAIIDNDGELEETRVQVTRLHQQMVKGTFPVK